MGRAQSYDTITDEQCLSLGDVLFAQQHLVVDSAVVDLLEQGKLDAILTENKYHGESYTKKLARLTLYFTIRQLFDAVGWPGGWELTLAGPEAAEVGALGHILGWPSHATVYADIDLKGAVVAFQKDMYATAVHADIRDVLCALKYVGGGIGFAHFDFMGHVTTVMRKTLE